MATLQLEPLGLVHCEIFRNIILLFASRICWYLIESILPSVKCSLCHWLQRKAETLSIRPFFLQTYFFLSAARKFYFNFISPQDSFPKIQQACLDVPYDRKYIRFSKARLQTSGSELC